MSVSPMQLLVVALVIVLLFGGRRLADIGKGLGSGIRNFKQGLANEEDDEVSPPNDAKPSSLDAKKPTR